MMISKLEKVSVKTDKNRSIEALKQMGNRPLVTRSQPVMTS